MKSSKRILWKLKRYLFILNFLDKEMSNNARIFLVGSIIATGITVLGVNYYIDEEKKVIHILYQFRKN